jgi:hypothetical protein
MSDSSVLEHINIKQRARFYTWSAKTLPISTKDINIHSANMHLIPATESIRNQFESIRVGSIVQIKGKLVEINSLEGRRWKSSITRKDTGGGACEIIWVESIVVVN